MFRAHFRAAFRDVAVADAGLLTQQLPSVLGIQRVHLQFGIPDHQPRAGEDRLVLLVVSDDVADCLAQEALDALAEFLDAVDVLLPHPVVSVGTGGRPWRECRHLRGLLVVVRDVRDKIPDHRERP